jgi:FAD/FMN-containing dehydrogenase
MSLAPGLRDLHVRHRGPVLDEADPGYDTARTSFNALLDRRPSIIARAAGVEDVVAAVAFAQEHGLAAAIRGGGHSVAGHSMCDGDMVVDLRLLHEVSVDADRRRVRVGGGATWRDVDAPLVAQGLTMPGGTFDTTGVAGLTLGGGLGHLMGVQGLTLDRLVSAQVVLASGDVVVASAVDETELFWALRGGGGNFGVVTRFEFALEPLPPVFGGMIRYGPADFGDGIRLFRDVMDAAPDELTLMAFLAHDFLHVTVCAVGDRDQWDEPVRRLRETLAVADDGLGLNSYLQIQVMQGDTPFGIRHYWKSHFVDALSEGLIEDIVEYYAGRATGCDSSILIEPLHGQARRVPLEDTAWNRRDPGYNVSVLGHWRDPAIDDAEIGWVRAGAVLVAAHSQDGGGYLNYGAPDEPADRVRAAFGDAKYERLRAIKHRYDPDNLFRYNHNIPPQATT